MEEMKGGASAKRGGLSFWSMMLYAVVYNAVLLAGVGAAALTPCFEEAAAGFVGFVLGAAVGSCLHLVWFRWKRGQALSGRASYCPMCLFEIPRRHNIPILSWLILRGKCFQCDARIPWNYVALEAAAGVLGAILGVGCAALF